jgi:argininosuccinate lyase
MAEEIVLWSTSEFRFARVGDTYATGSSIMPQKRNPDAAELVRGKAARVHGDLQTLLTLVKGLPLAYNRDLQEDKRPLFDALDTTTASVRMTARIWRTLELDADRFADELAGDFSLATEIADGLVRQGVAFRRAHEIVGRIVAGAERRGKKLDRLGRDELAELAGSMPDGVDLGSLDLDPRAAAERRVSTGGTASREIVRQVARLRETLG